MKGMKQQLFRIFKPYCKKQGFGYIPTQEMFSRTQGEVSHQFQVRCLQQSYGLLIEPGIGVRIELVEQLFHRTSGFEAKYQKWTPTIGAEIWRLEGKPKDFQYRLSNSEEALAIVEDLVSVFKTKALPYFAAYSSLSAIDQLLNDHPLDKTPHRMMEWLRASTGLIIARLVGRDNYDELTEVYRQKVSRLDKGFYLPQFKALIEDLHSLGREGGYEYQASVNSNNARET